MTTLGEKLKANIAEHNRILKEKQTKELLEEMERKQKTFDKIKAMLDDVRNTLTKQIENGKIEPKVEFKRFNSVFDERIRFLNDIRNYENGEFLHLWNEFVDYFIEQGLEVYRIDDWNNGERTWPVIKVRPFG